MKPLPISISFVWVVIFCGFISLLRIIGNLMVVGLKRHPAPPHHYVIGGDARLGREVLIRYGCGACHIIPGIGGATGRVGPSLEEIHRQVFIGGVLRNTPENLVSWIQKPQLHAARSAMPDLGVNEVEARHMAAYLYASADLRFQKWFRMWITSSAR